MKDWIAFLRKCVTTDLWGLVFLDFYQQEKLKGQASSPSRFIARTIPQILVEDIDPVAFHRVLACVSVQLLGNDFSTVFSQSFSFLRHWKHRLTEQQLDEICAHYSDYG